MIFFHTVTVYHLMESILFRKKYKKNEKAVLAIPDFIKYRWNEEYLQSLIDMGFFDDYMYLPYSEINLDDFNNTLEKSFTNKTLKYNLENFDEYYIGGVHYYISVFLFRIGKKVNAFEEANSAFSHVNILDDALKKCAPSHYNIASEHKLINYLNTNISHVICDFNNQDDEKIKSQKLGYLIHFSVSEELLKLDSRTLELMYKAFNVNPNITIEDNSVIIFTQHFMGLDMLDIFQQQKIYSLFIDLFFPNEKIYIKPHPDDFYPYQSKFLNCNIIRERFPAEFIPAICKNKNIKLGTLYSTSVNSIKSHFVGLIELSEDILYSFEQASIYSVIAKLFLSGNYAKCNTIVGDKCFLDKLIENDIHYKDKIENLCLNIILEKKGIDYDAILGKFNIEENYISNNYLLLGLITEKYDVEKNIYYVQIVEDNINEFDEHEISKKLLWFYIPEQSVREIINEFKYFKKFQITKKEVSAEMLNDNELCIARLEGKVLAAEKRIIYYKNKMQEKEEEIAQYIKIKKLINEINVNVEEKD